MSIRTAGVATAAEFPRRPLSFPARHQTHRLCAGFPGEEKFYA